MAALPQRVRARGSWVLGLLVAIVLSTGASAAHAQAQAQAPGATASLRDAAGNTVGTAELREGRGEVVVRLQFATPAALTGTHGLRVMSVGRCDPPTFQSAGDGFNPTGKPHGRQSLAGPQVGDLPNVNFTTGLTIYNTSVLGATLGSGPTSLLGPNGTALVLFANPDDQFTDPDGNAGARLACGVIMAATTNPLGQGGSLPPTGTLALLVGGLALIAGGLLMRSGRLRARLG
jgi:Cu-Zn family superoxide dismutase